MMRYRLLARIVLGMCVACAVQGQAETDADAATRRQLPNGFSTGEAERNVFDALWHAVKHGTKVNKGGDIESYESEEKKDAIENPVADLFNGIVATMRYTSSYDDRSPFTVAVYGSGDGKVSLCIANEWCDSTVLSLEPREELRRAHAELRGPLSAGQSGGNGPNNLILSSGCDDDAFGNFASGNLLVSTNDGRDEDGLNVEFCILEDLEPMVQGRLPHEFEEWIGSLVRGARVTVMRPQLPESLFFGYWDDMMALIRASLLQIDAEADVFEVSLKGKDSSSSDIPAWSRTMNDEKKSGGDTAIVIVRKGLRVSKARRRDRRKYDPFGSESSHKELHVGSSKTDFFIVPNKHNFVACDSRPVTSHEAADEDSSSTGGDRFEVIVTPTHIGVSRVDAHHGRGWGQDLKLTCETDLAAPASKSWSDPEETDRGIFTNRYVPWTSLQTLGLVAEDQTSLLVSLVRDMPSLPFVDDSDMALATKGVDLVDLYYGAAGRFYFAISHRDEDDRVVVRRLIPSSAVDRDSEAELESDARSDVWASHPQLFREDSDNAMSEKKRDEESASDDDVFWRSTNDRASSSSIHNDDDDVAASAAFPSSSPSSPSIEDRSDGLFDTDENAESRRLKRARAMHAQLNDLLDEKLPLATIEAMTDAEMDELDREIEKVRQARSGEQHGTLRGGGRRVLSIFNLRESQDQRVRSAASEKWSREIQEAHSAAASFDYGETVELPKMPDVLRKEANSARRWKSKNRRFFSRPPIANAVRGDFRRLWETVGAELSQEASKRSGPWTAIIYGGSPALELLALRIARSWPQSSDLAHNSGATVVSVVRDSKRANLQVQMTELLGLENAPVCHLPSLDASTARALVADPDQRFKFAVLGFDVVWGPLFESCDDDDDGDDNDSAAADNDKRSRALEENIDTLLRLGKTVFIEVPSASAIGVALWFMQDETSKGRASLRAFHETWRRWADSASTGDGDEMKYDDDNFVRSAIAAARQKRSGGDATPVVKLLEDRTPSRESVVPTRWIRVDMPNPQDEESEGAGESFVSLHALLHLRVVPQIKSELFRLFMQLHPPTSLQSSSEDLARAFAPWSVRLRPGNGHNTDAMLMPAPYPGISNGVRLGEWWSSVVDALRTEEIARTKHAAREARLFRSALDASERSGPATAADRSLFAQVLRIAGGDAKSRSLRASFDDPAVYEQLQREHKLRIAMRTREEMTDKVKGSFSFVEWNSGAGDMSCAIAEAFPNATVVSVAKREAAELHLEALKARGITNNAVCVPDTEDPMALETLRVVHDSPELFRFQMMGSSFVELLVRSDTAHDLGTKLGVLFTLAMTTFIQMPHPAVLSLALTTFFEDLGHQGPDRASARDRYDIRKHPRPAYRRSSLRLLQAATRLSEGNSVALRTVDETHLVRVDMMNMTRHVGHHVGYGRDGHRSKYVMTVEKIDDASLPKEDDVDRIRKRGTNMNAGGAVNVMLRTDKDADGNALSAEHQRHIPYQYVKAITLICVLRLGLIKQQRARLYFNFVHMPLYEDMAPWNIVLEGGHLGYIDSDTRDFRLDAHVARTYQVLSVLANYKRTVEDFEKCAFKGKNGRYNFPYISDCVGSWFSGPCDDPAYTVPCGDGKCHSDYISCLRSLADISREKEAKKRSDALRISGDVTIPGLHGTVYKADDSFSPEGFEGAWSYGSKGVVVEAK